MICSPLTLAEAERPQWRPLETYGPVNSRGVCEVVIKPRYQSHPCSVEVRYSWRGAAGAPTVIVQGGISANRDVASLEQGGTQGWWQELVGSGLALDLDHFRVLAIDWVTGADLGGGAVSSEDQADVLAALLVELGIGRVHGFVGASYGAMVGLAFAARHPLAVERLVLLAGAHRAHPLATAQRAIQREVVRLGHASGRVEEALALARQLAITTYRGSEEFSLRFDQDPEYRDGRFHFPVEDYLQHQGLRFARRFDPARFLALSESIDLHHVRPEAVVTPATLIGFTSDRLVPLADMCELQRRMGSPATLTAIASQFGHDGFLKEIEQLAPILREALG